MHEKARLRTVILGTGGTIAGRAQRAGDNVGYVAGEVAVADLVAGVPPLAMFPLDVEQLTQVDSKDMDFAIWQRLAARVAELLEREDVGGIVITHGTDTLEETAFFLQAVLQPTKPVVLACAMRPATALVPDGPQNLMDAVTVAREPGLEGVVAVCAGLVHRAEHVTKVHSYRTDAFDSGDAGPIGCVEEGVVRRFHPWPPAAPQGQRGTTRLARVLAARSLPRVELVTSHAGADGQLVRALMALGATHPDALPRGLVVAATGNGTVHRELEAALLEAKRAGVRVVRATRCARGRVIPSGNAPFPDSAGLSAVKARIALALELLED